MFIFVSGSSSSSSAGCGPPPPGLECRVPPAETETSVSETERQARNYDVWLLQSFDLAWECVDQARARSWEDGAGSVTSSQCGRSEALMSWWPRGLGTRSWARTCITSRPGWLQALTASSEPEKRFCKTFLLDIMYGFDKFEETPIVNLGK